MIIVDTITSKPHGAGKYEDIVLFADTKAEVPATGTSTAALVVDLDRPLPPATVIYTAACEVAVLGTDDNWVWKE